MAEQESQLSAGALFRQLRQDRHTTLQQVADAQCSVGFISKFERGERDISFTRIRHLLDRINVSLEEFMLLLNARNGQPVADRELLSLSIELRGIQLSAAYFQPFLDLIRYNDNLTYSVTPQALAKLKQFGDAALAANNGTARWQKFYRIYRHILLTIATTNLTQADARSHTPIEDLLQTFGEWSRPVTAYLYSVDHWGTFEFLMMRLFQLTMDLSSLRRFTKLAVRRAATQESNHNRALLFGILQGAFTRFVAARQFQDAKQCIQWHAALNDVEDVYYSMFNQFMRGWLLIHQGQVARGQQQCQRLIAILQELGMTSTAQLWKYHLRVVIASYEQPNKYGIFM